MISWSAIAPIANENDKYGAIILLEIGLMCERKVSNKHVDDPVKDIGYRAQN